MDNFSERAKTWDANPMNHERSAAIAEALITALPDTSSMRLLDFGAGTGILGGLLAPRFKEIVLMDTAEGMVDVMKQKVAERRWNNVMPVCHDLLAEEYKGASFDCIVLQLVLHHIEEVSTLLARFNHLLNTGGYLVIADMYAEDGSFHGEGFNGHNGFEQEWLEQRLNDGGFEPLSMQPCYVIHREREEVEREYPVFLSVSRKK
jgi:2-polyprenyl-3-methyl-5-hydroxy-6-metoxy-1,4-benzoquinol methylase